MEENGVHAIVGPNASGAALPIVEAVIGPGRVPTVSPSATSPQLTESPDDDFFFRTTLSDIAQGPVLARVTREQGYDNVGLIYIDDAYGQGLAASFEETWEGTLEAVAVGADQTTYLPQLRQSAIAGGRALVIISFEAQALEIVRQALDEGIYQRFFFGDAAKRERLVQEIGGALLGNMYGTAGSAAPDSQATVEWEESFMAEYGRLSEFPYVKETYDATVALALAAQAAGNLNGEAIRDQLSSGKSPERPDSKYWARRLGCRRVLPCWPTAAKSTTKGWPARWTGTRTATSKVAILVSGDLPRRRASKSWKRSFSSSRSLPYPAPKRKAGRLTGLAKRKAVVPYRSYTSLRRRTQRRSSDSPHRCRGHGAFPGARHTRQNSWYR